MLPLLLALVLLDETQPGVAFVEVHTLTQTGIPVFNTLEPAPHVFFVLLTVIWGKDRKADFGRSPSIHELSTRVCGPREVMTRAKKREVQILFTVWVCGYSHKI